MPYISQSRRPYWDQLMKTLLKAIPLETNAGDLAYILYRLVRSRMAMVGTDFAGKALHMGILLLVMLELWHKDVRPYEDKKMEKNGDVD